MAHFKIDDINSPEFSLKSHSLACIPWVAENKKGNPTLWVDTNGRTFILASFGQDGIVLMGSNGKSRTIRVSPNELESAVELLKRVNTFSMLDFIENMGMKKASQGIGMRSNNIPPTQDMGDFTRRTPVIPVPSPDGLPVVPYPRDPITCGPLHTSADGGTAI